MSIVQQLPRLWSVCCVMLLLQTPLVDCQDCHPECHVGHGICVNGQCLCSSPWGGEDCSSLVAATENSVTEPPHAQVLTSAQLDEDQGPRAVEEDRVVPASLEFEPVPIDMPSPPAKAGANFMRRSEASAQQSPTAPGNARFTIAAFNSVDSMPPRQNHGLPTQLIDVETQHSTENHRSARGINRMKTRNGKAIFTVVGSSGDKDDETRSADHFQRQLKLMEIADSQETAVRDTNIARRNFDAYTRLLEEKSKTTRADVEVCYYMPAAIQGGILLLLAVFVGIDVLLRSCFDTTRHLDQSWCCCCFVGAGRCILTSNWRTFLFGFIFLVVVNSIWGYLCYTGTITQYLEQAAFVIYVAFVFLGAFALLVMELYYRFGKQRVDQIRHLEHKVDELVGLLGVKYGEALQRQRERLGKVKGNMMDKADDVTDFLGVTEASSEDDITCMQAMRCQAPQKNPNLKPKTQREQMKKSLVS